MSIIVLARRALFVLIMVSALEQPSFASPNTSADAQAAAGATTTPPATGSKNAAASGATGGSDAAAALDPAKSIVDNFTSLINAETTVSDSSGLTLLGVTATDINRPTTPKDFVAAIAKGTDASGKAQDGFALEISPFGLFAPYMIRGGALYVDSPLMQAQARTSISLATAKSDDARIGSQIAASIRVGLIDQGDPRLEWGLLDKCAKAAMKKLVLPGPENPGAEPVGEDAAITEAKACYKTAFNNVHDLWARPSWYVGYAKAWYTGESQLLKDAVPGAKVFWSSYSVGWPQQNEDRKGLFQLYAAKKWDDRIANPKDATKFSTEDRTDVIARVRYGPSNWHVFVDAGLARVNTEGIATENVRRRGFGGEFQVSDTMWIVFGSITESGYLDASSKRTLLSTGLRFGQSSKSMFAPIAPVVAPKTGAAEKAAAGASS